MLGARHRNRPKDSAARNREFLNRSVIVDSKSDIMTTNRKGLKAEGNPDQIPQTNVKLLKASLDPNA